MESKIGFIFKSIYVMLIPNCFIYLFNILCKVLIFLPVFNDKEGCRNKVFSSHSMSHYHKGRYRLY